MCGNTSIHDHTEYCLDAQLRFSSVFLCILQCFVLKLTSVKFALATSHKHTKPRVSILAGYESAGVSYVNGERVQSGNNANPYANANAPPMPANPVSNDGGYHRSSSSGGSLGYPPYPSNSGSSANGYPPPPQSNNQAGRQHDLGYPPYPTQNRMPVPGQPAAYPNYPQPAGYPQQYPPSNNYPQQYPGYQNYPYQNYPNQRGHNSNSIYRRNAASTGTVASVILVAISELFLSFVNRVVRWWSVTDEKLTSCFIYTSCTYMVLLWYYCIFSFLERKLFRRNESTK